MQRSFDRKPPDTAAKSGMPSTQIDDPFTQISRLQLLMHQNIMRTTRLNRALEIITLLLTISTAGALWVLASGLSETFAIWIGALVSSLAALVSGYQVSVGPRRQLEKQLPIYENITKAMGGFRDGKLARWSDYKEFLSEMIANDIPIQIAPPLLSEEQKSRMTASEIATYEQIRQQSYPQ